MDSIECAKRRIRAIMAGSKVTEDPTHAENTLEWLLRLDPKSNQALQIAAKVDRGDTEYFREVIKPLLPSSY